MTVILFVAKGVAFTFSALDSAPKGGRVDLGTPNPDVREVVEGLVPPKVGDVIVCPNGVDWEKEAAPKGPFVVPNGVEIIVVCPKDVGGVVVVFPKGELIAVVCPKDVFVDPKDVTWVPPPKEFVAKDPKAVTFCADPNIAVLVVELPKMLFVVTGALPKVDCPLKIDPGWVDPKWFVPPNTGAVPKAFVVLGWQKIDVFSEVVDPKTVVLPELPKILEFPNEGVWPPKVFVGLLPKTDDVRVEDGLKKELIAWVVPKAVDCPNTGGVVIPPPKIGLWDVRVPKFCVVWVPNAGAESLEGSPNKEAVLVEEPNIGLLLKAGFEPNMDPVLVAVDPPNKEFSPVEPKLPPNGFPEDPKGFPLKTLGVEEEMVAPNCGVANEKFDGLGVAEVVKAVSCALFWRFSWK